jgi:hypothetical protein
MRWVGFEPRILTSERAKIVYTLGRSATVTGVYFRFVLILSYLCFITSKCFICGPQHTSFRQPIWITGVSCAERILNFHLFLLSLRRRSVTWGYYFLCKTWETSLSYVSCSIFKLFHKKDTNSACRFVSDSSESWNECAVVFSLLTPRMLQIIQTPNFSLTTVHNE